MTRIEANAYLAVILEVVDASKGAPSGHIYAGMMGRISLDDYQTLLALAKRAELLTERGHWLALTDKGRAMVVEIAEHRARATGCAS